MYEISNGSGFYHLHFSYSAAPTSRWITFTSIPGLVAGSTYQIRVAAKVGGTWHGFGPSCDVTMPPAQIPSLRPPYCGYSLGSMSEYVHTSTVHNAERYAYESTDDDSFYHLAFSHYSAPSSTWMSMALVPGAQYNTTYHIRVMAKVNGTWGAFGPSCDVTTPTSSSKTALERFGTGASGLEELLVFPNPAHEHVTVVARGLQGDEALLRVYNTLGALLHTERLAIVAGQTSTQLQLQGELPAGSYLLQLQTENGSMRKILVVR